MAVTADTVTVRLEAQVSKYLSDLRAAESQSNSTATALARAANTAAAAITQQSRAALEALRAAGNASAAEIQAAQATLQKARASEQATRAEVRRVAALRAEAAAQSSVGEAAQTAANQVTAATARADAATNNLSLNTGNIAAQFQDIGVTAAAGMNPLIIALQQGTQLSAVLNQSVSQGVSPVRALGGAFLQVINPISLATIATIALGAAALQSLGNIIPKAETATEALKRHRETLEDVVRGYGGAEDAVSAYFDQVERLPQFALNEQLQTQFTNLEKAATALPVRLQDVADYIRALGGSATDTDREILSLVEQFQEGRISLEDLYSELGTAADGMGVLESAAGQLGIGARKTIDDLRALIVTVTQFGDEYARFLALTQIKLGAAPVNEDLQNALDLKVYIEEQQRLNGYTAEQLALYKEIARIKADQPAITDERAKQLAEETLAAEKRRADLKKADTKGTRDYERERKEVTDLLEAMGLEAALLGQSNREKAIAVALSKANATATQEELDAISQSAAFIYDTEQAIKKLNETSTEWANTIQSATRGFIDDLIAGKSAAEAFGNVLGRVADQFLTLGLNNLFGTGGFNLAGLFGNTGFPTRAMGGNVYAGVPTQINERGQEIFIPTQPGRMVPASQVGGGGNVTFAPVIDARGADVAAVARLERAVQDVAAQVVPAIRREMATAGKKGRSRG